MKNMVWLVYWNLNGAETQSHIACRPSWWHCVSCVCVLLADKDKKMFRGFAMLRGSSSSEASSRSVMSTPVTLKAEVDSESSRRCMMPLLLV